MSNELIKRSWLAGASATSDQLTVLQWNCLADWAADAFPQVDPAYLAWKYRRPLIVAECLRADPDIICLQEIDHFEELKDALGASYEGHFKSKGKKVGEDSRDGGAIFWKPDRLRVIESSDLHFSQLCQDPSMKQIFMSLVFELKTGRGKQRIRVLATHLKAKAGFDQQRTSQCHAITKFLNAGEGHEDLLVICGDFNTQANSSAITGLLEKTSAFNLSSVYRSMRKEVLNSDSEPDFTTWKIRDTVKKQTIDFVFYDQNSKWKPIDVWLMPAEESIDPSVALPCAAYPSDHLSLAAKFELIGDAKDLA